MNMLKYWARSSRLGQSLPINASICEDSLYVHKITDTKNTHKKLPYAQQVRTYIQQHELQDIQIAKPTYKDIPNISNYKPDLTLTEITSKQYDSFHNEITANWYLGNILIGWEKIYTDGSKDPRLSKTGIGIVRLGTENEIISETQFNAPGDFSIYSCELTAINMALTSIINQKRSRGEAEKIAILSDSLSSLMSISRGVPKNRPEIIQQIIRKL